MCATFVLTIGVAAGLAYAGTVVYEKVFKKPEKLKVFWNEYYSSINFKEKSLDMEM